MLSTRFPARRAVVAALARRRRRWRSPAAPPAGWRARRRHRRRSRPAGARGAARALRLGRPGARRDRAAASRTRRGWRRPTCATRRSTSRSTRSAGTTAGGAAAAQQAIAEGAKIIVGPLFSTETAGAAAAGRARPALTVLSLSNNPSVAGGNVFILGTSFENTADRLVGFGQSRGHAQLRRRLLRPGSRARPRATRSPRSSTPAAPRSSPRSPTTSRSRASRPRPARPSAALLSGGAQAVILTDGPTGGLGFISEALRNNGVTPDQAQFMGMQQWDASAEALALPSLQGGGLRRARPEPRRRLRGPLPHRLRRGAARARRPRLRRHPRGRRDDRRGAVARRQPVLDRAADRALGLRRRLRPVPLPAERPGAAQPRDRRGPRRQRRGDRAGGEVV